MASCRTVCFYAFQMLRVLSNIEYVVFCYNIYVANIYFNIFSILQYAASVAFVCYMCYDGYKYIKMFYPNISNISNALDVYWKCFLSRCYLCCSSYVSQKKYVAIVINICCNNTFKMWHLFQAHVASVFIGRCTMCYAYFTCVRCMLQ